MGISAEVFHEMIGVKDAYKAPERLLEILYNREEREQLFRDFLASTSYNVDDDMFRQYFEDCHASRKDLKQDFTPASVAKLTAALVNRPQKESGGFNDRFFPFYEGCAGSGTMLIHAWNADRMKHSPFDYKPSWYFYCVEELDDRVFPFLLFNIAIRGMNACVIHCDVLSRSAKGAFFIQNDTDNALGFSSINRLPYDKNVEYELAVAFDEHLYDELLESPGVPEHVVRCLMEGDDSREPSEATKFIYALCGVDGFNFETEETTS